MKLGIIGSGTIVEEVLGFIHELEFEEIYICGRIQSKEKVQDLAEDYEVDKVFFDYNEILNSDVDVIYIGLPNDMHYEYSKRAIEAKKHVIVEKPATITLSQLEELEELAHKNKVFYFEGMSIYHMPAFKKLKDDVAKVGSIRIVNFNYSQLSRKYFRFCQGETIPVFDKNRYGGALRDINIYNISAMVGLFGKPNSVDYFANIEKDIDVSGMVIADYGNYKACLTGAKDCNAPGPSTIQGDAGTICIYPNVNGISEYDIIYNDKTSDTEEIDLSEGCSRLLYEFEEFIRIIEESDDLSCNKLMEMSKIVAGIIDDCTRG